MKIYFICLYSPPLDNTCSREGEVLLLCVCVAHMTGGFILHKIHSLGDVNKLRVQHINLKL